MNAATKPVDAVPGTIRGDLAVEMGQNLVHASDSAESAATELSIWFTAGELVSYRRDIDRWVLGPRS
jgi:nucleoside-diphosphate kinase